MPREKSGTEAAVSDAPENANEEFGHGDQQFGGGPGDVEYGAEPLAVGKEGVVADDNVKRGLDRLVTDDEQEGIVLPGTDEDDLATTGQVAAVEEE